jgi:hypothetical protein
MGFASLDIVQGIKFEAFYFIRDDTGLFYRDLTGATAKFEIFKLEDKSFVYSPTATVNTVEAGKHFVKVEIPANDTRTYFTPTIEDEDDGRLRRSGYYGVLTVDNVNGETAPIIGYISKINVV